MDYGWAPFVFHIHFYVHIWMTWCLLVPSKHGYQEVRLKFQRVYNTSPLYVMPWITFIFGSHFIQLLSLCWHHKYHASRGYYLIIYDTTKVGTYIESLFEILEYGWWGVYIYGWHQSYTYVGWTYHALPWIRLLLLGCERKIGRFHFICGQGKRGLLWTHMIWDTHLVW